MNKTYIWRSTTIAQTAARLAFGCVLAFLFLLTSLHFLEPEFDPSWRWISEYELGRYGWVMSLAFYSLGAGSLALLTAIWPSLRTITGQIGKWWLLLIAIALFGAGYFSTLPVNDPEFSAGIDIHGLCGAFVIFTFPVTASLLAASLARASEWIPARRLLLWATLLVWVGMLTFWGSMIFFLRMQHTQELRFGPEVLIGWPNRFMMATYCVWLMVSAWWRMSARRTTRNLA
jgi:NAD/NADP transhydrogenase beta subunit